MMTRRYSVSPLGSKTEPAGILELGVDLTDLILRFSKGSPRFFAAGGTTADLVFAEPPTG